MDVDASTIIGILTLSSGAVAVGGAWVISVEKRINGLRSLQRTIERVDRRTERLSFMTQGRDVADDRED